MKSIRKVLISPATAVGQKIATLAVSGMILAGALVTAPAVEAQVVCTTRGEILGALSRSYSEQPAALGVASNGGVMELLTSEDGGTWTLIMTMPSGQTCVMASGESWMSVPRRVADQAS